MTQMSMHFMFHCSKVHALFLPCFIRKRQEEQLRYFGDHSQFVVECLETQ